MGRKVLRVSTTIRRARIMLLGRCPRCSGPIHRESLRCPSCGWVIEKDEVLNAFGRKRAEVEADMPD